MNDELVQPEVIFCGFSRISPVRRRQEYHRAQSIAESQEILLTISLLDANRYTFTTAIHKQADIQTLARTIEALLSERRTVVACLVDLGSDIILRWSDTVDDVLDSDSVVGIIPLSNATLVRTMQSAPSPSVLDTVIQGGSSPVKALTTPLPQLEFIHMNPVNPRANSFHGSISSLTDNFYIDTALIRKRSDMQHHRPALKALRIIRPTSAKSATQAIPTVEPYATSYLPPLPTSPIPKARESSLVSICSNSILLLAFCRYCARKKTLCELLYWLDTSSNSATEDFTYRTYLAEDAPLKLNLPREVSTTIEARELLRDGVLTWSEQGFEQSDEGMRARAIQSEKPAFFKTASILLNGPVHPARTSFIDLLSTALHPEDTSILSLKERRSTDTKQAILDQVCAQYFPGKQVDKAKYFEFKEHHLTKPERLRSSNRRQIYGGLFDRDSSPQSYSHTSFRRSSQASTLSATRQESGIEKNNAGAKIGEIMPMEDADLHGWSDVATDWTMASSKANPRLSRNGVSVLGATRTSSEKGRPGSDMSFVTLEHRRAHHSTSASVSSSTKSDDTQNTPVIGLTESERADFVRRQTKLRTLLGATPRDMLDRQADHMTTELASSRPDLQALSPTPSMLSRFTTASDSSRLSLFRAENEEDAERRTQVRRAAKLYAMFGEHANSPSSIPSYRQSSRARNTASDHTGRPQSSASQYSPAVVRSPSRGSISARSMYEPSSGRQNVSKTPDSKYRSNRDGDRRSFKSLMFKSPKDSKLPPDVLSTFPAPPSTGSPSSPSFRHSIRGNNGFSPRSLYGDTDSIMEELASEDEEDLEGEAIVQDVRTNMKLRQLLGNDAPTSTIG